MPTPQPIFQPFARTRWLSAGRIRPWRAPDHLLLVENRFFTEQYTRLFWSDIQAVLLFRLHASSSVVLALEILCVLAVLSPVFFQNPGSALAGRWPLLPGLLFLALYAVWRLPRPQWACEISTRTNVKQFPLPGNAISCRRVFDEIKIRVTDVQGLLSETPPDSAAPLGSPATPATSRTPPKLLFAKQPLLAVHVIAFVLGLLSPFSRVVFGFYCAALFAAWFLQRDFRFPFAVRSAAVMSQLFASLRIAAWILVAAHVLPGLDPLPFNDWRFGLPTVLFSLYGIAAAYWVSLQLERPREKTGAGVLGLS